MIQIFEIIFKSEREIMKTIKAVIILVVAEESDVSMKTGDYLFVMLTGD